MKKALTAKTLDALKGKEKRYDVHDLHCPGLSVRVSENGRKVFSVKFRFGLEQKRVTLGVYTIPQKLDALTAHIWNSKAENGSSVTGVITYILYGGPDDLLPERRWEAVADPKWKLECMGISAYGELVGWAMPDKFPPRNGRTSKALRSLGYDVQVHVP